MFVIVPAIIIFLALSYLFVNDDVSLVVEVVVYIFCVVIFLLSAYTYRSIQKNLHQQEINKILIEIQNLKKKLNKSKDEAQKDILSLKIKKLGSEIK